MQKRIRKAFNLEDYSSKIKKINDILLEISDNFEELKKIILSKEIYFRTN